MQWTGERLLDNLLSVLLDGGLEPRSEKSLISTVKELLEGEQKAAWI